LQILCGRETAKNPFNALATSFRDVSVKELAEAGAKRISIGGALNWAAVNPILTAGKEILEMGKFNWTAEMASNGEVKKLLG